MDVRPVLKRNHQVDVSPVMKRNHHMDVSPVMRISLESEVKVYSIKHVVNYIDFDCCSIVLSPLAVATALLDHR